MFGWKHAFEYIECSRCGSLQIADVPSDLEKYYPKEYYSFCASQPSMLEEYLKRKQLGYFLGRRSLLGRILSIACGCPEFLDWIRRTGISPEDKILDVGCGNGHLLKHFEIAGFHHLTGIDPYLKEEKSSDSVTLYRKFLSEMDGAFDFIYMSHSLEHTGNPAKEMAEIYRLLRPQRYALVSVPVASSYAWRKYDINWVQLDAPRHLFIPSSEGLRILVERSGFELREIVFDSYEFQFWGSELYERGLKLAKTNPKAHFRRRQLRAYRRQAESLNAAGDGDSACFYLWKD
jgi:SAM-dependent methyltransferase